MKYILNGCLFVRNEKTCVTRYYCAKCKKPVQDIKKQSHTLGMSVLSKYYCECGNYFEVWH